MRNGDELLKSSPYSLSRLHKSLSWFAQRLSELNDDQMILRDMYQFLYGLNNKSEFSSVYFANSFFVFFLMFFAILWALPMDNCGLLLGNSLGIGLFFGLFNLIWGRTIVYNARNKSLFSSLITFLPYCLLVACIFGPVFGYLNSIQWEVLEESNIIISISPLLFLLLIITFPLYFGINLTKLGYVFPRFRKFDTFLQILNYRRKVDLWILIGLYLVFAFIVGKLILYIFNWSQQFQPGWGLLSFLGIYFLIITSVRGLIFKDFSIFLKLVGYGLIVFFAVVLGIQYFNELSPPLFLFLGGFFICLAFIHSFN